MLEERVMELTIIEPGVRLGSWEGGRSVPITWSSTFRISWVEVVVEVEIIWPVMGWVENGFLYPAMVSRYVLFPVQGSVTPHFMSAAMDCRYCWPNESVARVGVQVVLGAAAESEVSLIVQFGYCRDVEYRNPTGNRMFTNPCPEGMSPADPAAA